MGLIAGELYEKLAVSNIDIMSPEFSEQLLTIFQNHSFSPEMIKYKPQMLAMIPLLTEKLKCSLENNSFLSMEIVKDCVKQINFMEYLSFKRQDETFIYFETAAVIVLYVLAVRGGLPNQGNPKFAFYNDADEFMNDYCHLEEFKDPDIDDLEKKKLLYFVNIMKVTLLLIPVPKGNKERVHTIVCRAAEGRHAKYVFGGASKLVSRRREKLFHIESGVEKVKRPIRINDIVKILRNDALPASQVTQQVVEYVKDRQVEPKDVVSISFPYPSQPNIQVDATEMITQSGTSIVRSISISRKLENYDDYTVGGYEILRSVNITSVTNNESKDTAEEEFNRSIEDFECNIPEGVALSRQTFREPMGIVRGVSISRQLSLRDIDSDLWLSDLNMSDLIRGGSIMRYATGDHSLLRNISKPLNSSIFDHHILPSNNTNKGLTLAEIVDDIDIDENHDSIDQLNRNNSRNSSHLSSENHVSIHDFSENANNSTESDAISNKRVEEFNDSERPDKYAKIDNHWDSILK